MDTTDTLLVTTSPHIHQGDTTARIMWTVSACLAPAGIWGIYVFGLRALLVILVALVAALAGEFLAGRLTGRRTLTDGSAFVTGLLVAYNMPPDVPLYIPVVASLFGILVVKWCFGGLGCNWMNPALGGRVFVFFSWTGGMTSWRFPSTMQTVDTISGASPLGFVKTGFSELSGEAASVTGYLRSAGYPFSPMDGRVTAFLNDTFGFSLSNGYVDQFVGNIPGCIGEVSALFLILGAVVLFIRKIITWEIPVFYLGSFSLLMWIFGGTAGGQGFFQGDVLFHLFTGGLMLGAFYMATDMVTSPVTRKGMMIFGLGCGFFTFLIRRYGSFPEGVSLAIIFMNILVPMINRVTGPKRFGFAGKERKE
ncbi:MAG: RnfABCDGE type electron transport complex subunit D [Spirochaetales bacterium]|nr:RnfABCDGE type electron transport complex subunit D [Spirochaetales bacterium]